MSIKRIATIAALTAIALTIFMLEAQIPVIIAVPGVKLGLSNIVTLIAVYILSKRDAGIILALRIMLGSIFAGNSMIFLYSAAGGLLSFASVCLTSSFLREKQIWAVGVLSAIAHNAAQIAVAALVMDSLALFWYLPWLIIAAIITGAFTGLSAQFAVNILKKPRLR
jgi:heptaprenyl diphosphate synthase